MKKEMHIKNKREREIKGKEEGKMRKEIIYNGNGKIGVKGKW